jgi:hypothetical protein
VHTNLEEQIPEGLDSQDVVHLPSTTGTGVGQGFWGAAGNFEVRRTVTPSSPLVPVYTRLISRVDVFTLFTLENGENP